MTKERIELAVLAAREFLRRADLVRERFEDAQPWASPCRETGALRRQSLELTMALAEMRRP